MPKAKCQAFPRRDFFVIATRKKTLYLKKVSLDESGSERIMSRSGFCAHADPRRRKERKRQKEITGKWKLWLLVTLFQDTGSFLSITILLSINTDLSEALTICASLHNGAE